MTRRKAKRLRRGELASSPKTCLFCGKVLANVFCLEAHIHTHTLERPYTCAYCDATFPTKPSEITHVNNIHRGIKHECENCGKLFNSKSNLCHHVRNGCPEGTRTISRQLKKKKRLNVRTSTGQGSRRNVPPPKRKKSSPIKSLVKTRRKKKSPPVKKRPRSISVVAEEDEEEEKKEHDDLLPLMEDDEDGNGLSIKQADIINAPIIKEKEEKVLEPFNNRQTAPFKPSNRDCLTFLTPSSIQLLFDWKRQEMQAEAPRWDPSFFLHMGRYRPEDSSIKVAVDTVQVKSEIDEEKLESDSTIKAEVTYADGGEHRCQTCGKIYSTKWNLLKHVKIHTGKMEYQCHFCQKLFFEKCNAVRHIISMHQNPEGDPAITTNLKRPRCGFCGERFYDGTAALTRHILTEHNEMLLVPTE